ncbi:glycosyltransferase family A protein [Actinomyces howellii]|uniref:Glycosyl transferase family 2 n=1 Tax=Actinomyces howellii TaxID=52771 RepID=A0A448HJI3_9ACTO|nr:glycosyltransferase family A protein [Actinomyces howellii]VEG29882.1 Glycosyl transferase family 2 [Actinomyces howellii]
MSTPPPGPPTTERTDLGRPAPGAALVDVVIACHNPARPVGRAVASVLDGNPEACVTVVCHNRRAEEIAQAIDPAHRDRVRYLEHRDPRPSASGPFNAGIRAARTPWVSIMGSDDSLAPGAVASWLRLARATGAEFIVPRLALGAPGRIVPTPAPRPSRLVAPCLAGLGPRRSRLPRPLALRLALIGRGLAAASLVADRLSYRSAPLGLMSVAMLAREGLSLVEGATVGGDVAMVTRMFATVPTAYDSRGPVYLIGEDASDRVTYVVRPLAEQLGFLDDLLDADWARDLDLRSRRAVAAKMTRIHLFGAVHYRPDPGLWTEPERADLQATSAHLEAFAPGYGSVLSRAETALLRACLDPRVPAGELIALSAARRRHGRPSTLLTGSPLTILAREAPLRLMGASVLTKMVPARRRS